MLQVLRQCIERACADDGFVAEVFTGHTEDRRVRTRSKHSPSPSRPPPPPLSLSFSPLLLFF
eukprot:COSAG03_NODE_10567_length_633_cov_15.388582_1_plen_61_part_10